MELEVKGLCKRFGKQQAVQDLNFSLPKGCILGFLGPNAAGKSTTLRMLSGTLSPDAGAIKIAGIDLLKHPLEAKRKIGYLPEHNPLYGDMYIPEYLNFMADIFKLPAKQQRVKEVMDMLGLMPEKHKKIIALSKGYKQRVGLAQAIIHDPELLILDEPTSGLDPNQLVDIRKLIRQWGESKTVIFSTHILQEVEELCSDLLIIHQGQQVAFSSMDKLKEISRKDNLNELFMQLTSQ